MEDKKIVTFDQLTTLVDEITDQIDKSIWRPDIVVGISRGGLLAATMLSHYYDCDFQALSWSAHCDLDNGNESNLWLPEDALQGKKTLIVDDIGDSGKTLKEIKEDWNSSVAGCKDDLDWGDTIRFATLHQRYTCDFKINYVAEHIVNSDWVVYPYENWWQS